MLPIQVQPRQQLEALIPLVTNTLRSASSQRAYGRALRQFFQWYQGGVSGGGLTRATVQAYKAHLMSLDTGAVSINHFLSAIKKLAEESELNGLIDPVTCQGILRIEGVKRLGNRTGNWLDRGRAEDIIRQPDRTTLKGKRDAVILGLMIGCGLRREEVVGLRVEQYQQRDGRGILADVIGKGHRVRTVPVPEWACRDIEAWIRAVGPGALLRPVNRAGRLSGESMTAAAAYQIVRFYAHVAPHDLRRTFARLARDGGAEIDQIRFSLGHSSTATTERYIGGNQNLVDAPCDHLGITLDPKGGE